MRIDRNVVAGGYSLFVEAEASSLSLGTALVSVAVLNAVTGEPVPGASVVVHTRHNEHGETGWATALPVPERPEIYRARMKLERPGRWDMSVAIDGPVGRAEARAGTITIPKPRAVLGRVGGVCRHVLHAALWGRLRGVDHPALHEAKGSGQCGLALHLHATYPSLPSPGRSEIAPGRDVGQGKGTGDQEWFA